ncbi:SPOR domain-containing protein [Chitiniphilus purpureus]|uniref:SPOR domain-containing protein n=1 Tax=Chitiniphilus purpureus TaxID=2981137 RepID=A0ABY6DIT5_9NEIS|nr:SPOR domain-containing protein [Chitiniphilus sp. CD1]UXY14259.1 SPOR domain-containing protein [Chitiniphilus sp. CD1]
MSEGQDPLLREAEQHRLREQVFWRLGIAAGLIVIILAGIYLLDRPASSPVTVTGTQPRIAPAVPTNRPAIPIRTPPTAQASAPAAIGTPASSPAATPSPTASTVTAAPATTTPVQATGAVATPLPSPRPATAVPSRADRPTMQAPQPVAPTAAQPVERTEHYTVQAGVFLHADNAEKLLRQLQRAGVPAYLETRVQLGPFKNKAEADAASRKLRELGIEPVRRNE